jgi:hypothetical protein
MDTQTFANDTARLPFEGNDGRTHPSHPRQALLEETSWIEAVAAPSNWAQALP